MSQRVDTRTIHTITIDLEDQVLAGIESGDEVEIIFMTRSRPLSPKKLTFRDVSRLLEDPDNIGRRYR